MCETELGAKMAEKKCGNCANQYKKYDWIPGNELRHCEKRNTTVYPTGIPCEFYKKEKVCFLN